MMRMLKITFKTFKEVFKVIPVYASLYVIATLLAAFLRSAGTYVTSLVCGGAYEIVSGSSSASVFYKLIGLYLAVYFLDLILDIVSGFLRQTGFFHKGPNMFKIRLGEYAAKLSLIDLEKPDVLNLLERARRSVQGNKITNLVFNIMAILQGSLTLIGVSAVLASFSVWLIPVAVLSCIPTAVVKIVRGEHFYQLQKKQIPKVRTLGYLWSLFLSPTHIKEMRVLGFSGYLSGRWEAINMEVSQETWDFEKKDASIMFFFDFFKVACYTLGIFFSVYLTYKGMISIGQFGACLTAFMSLQRAAFNVVRQLSAFTGNCPFVDDYFKFLEIEPEGWGTKEFNGLNDRIELKNICFKYPNADKNVLDDITLSIKKGEKVALIGENGSGKTTLSKIIIGLYPPGSGSLHYDGAAVNSYDIRSFYDRISIVSQNYTRYYMSLRENTGISDTARIDDDEKIIRALKRAEIEDTMNKTNGLDGMLGREFGGAELSGGQWQKLAVARGLFKDYDFIVLDEPTSALDPIVETEIFTRFIEAMENKTALIISHRVGLCRLVDKIVVLRDGRVCESGSHRELMSRKGAYYELFTSQQSWYV